MADIVLAFGVADACIGLPRIGGILDWTMLAGFVRDLGDKCTDVFLFKNPGAKGAAFRIRVAAS